MSIVALALVAPALAAAAPDLVTTLTQPSGAYVYASAQWQVKVQNSGNRDASAVTLNIQLPETNTSPQVYVMGTVGSMSSSCSRSGTDINCNLGTLRKGKSSTVSFYMTLPESAGSLDFVATAATTSSESNTTNNVASASASLLNHSPSFSGDTSVNNNHCTGTGLESYFECELFPSSISSHTAVFHDDADQSISFPDYPDYWGTWDVSGTELVFVIESAAGVEAEFVGYGVGSNCWEGITTFPGSSYVSPYEVCF
ncbi:MAG: hypothetical protein FJ102_06435 [Deltaproteobacteria bacterium]|nr:hypothetical protein [Deltaproteobacteria bacterium]